ncbi:hypothetical protein GQR58_025367 [Nymphon striatum]|nr:hypothetical protein GQR58_025367 [Nymphon striatum]
MRKIGRVWCEEEQRRELLFEDDRVTIADTKGAMQENIAHWQEALRRDGLKVNAGKPEVMSCHKDGGLVLQVKYNRGEEMKQVKEEGVCLAVGIVGADNVNNSDLIAFQDFSSRAYDYEVFPPTKCPLRGVQA